MKHYLVTFGLVSMMISSTLVISVAAFVPAIRLPTELVTMRAVSSHASYFEITLSDIPMGFDITNGSYPGWCVQKNIQMTQGVSHTVLLFSSYDPLMPEGFRSENWDKINYVLNHKHGGCQSIQDAIWYYTNLSQYPADSDAQLMIAEAEAQGAGFVPHQGQQIAILIEGVPVIQRTFVELTLPPKLTLGDLVWNDFDADGIQESGEPGLSGVTVSLYTANGTLVDATLTDTHGVYSFAYFPLGRYYLEFSLLDGFLFSPKDQGADETRDSDADPITGRTDIMVFDPEVYDTSWDAGMYQPGALRYLIRRNHAPTADGTAGEPYRGFVNDTITFDGSRSYDRDGWIISWEWIFGDGTNGTGAIIKHSYNRPGRYPVTLTVTDNEYATDTYSTTAVIRLGNYPPLTPMLSAVSFGHTNMSYVLWVMAMDPDKNPLRYVFAWSDGSQSESPWFQSGHGIYTIHQWNTPGFYTLRVFTFDPSNATSEEEEMRVAIDVWYVQSLGYLLNTDGDDIFDLFFSNQTKTQTRVQQLATDTYLIDANGDGFFDYQYDFQSGRLQKYPEHLKFEYILVLVVLGVMILVILLLSYVMIWRNGLVLHHRGGHEKNHGNTIGK
jgi:PKD repeat protein